MDILIKNISQLITCSGTNKQPKKGIKQSEIGLLKNSNVYISGGIIKFLGNNESLSKFIKDKKNFLEINGVYKTVMPGFIDSHTHLVFAGTRSDEYEMRIRGMTYEDIAKSGGGIQSTVNAVRKTSKDVLKNIALSRLNNFISHGTTTIEAKSGYGLDTENELKMLEVINEVGNKNKHGIDIIPTFLGAHSVPAGMKKEEYIEEVVKKMIPPIVHKRLAKFIDIFCEKNYFNNKDTYYILSEGKKHGLIPKIHTEQFNSIGGIDVAVKLKVISADHLEVIKPADINKLSGTNIIATLLPGVSYFLDIKYPPVRKLIEKNVPVALATDFNPGSCMTENIQIIMSIASVKLKMTAEEIINAVTINPAFALDIQNKTGSIEKGKQADMLIFDFSNYRDLLYHFAVNQIEYVIKKGKIIHNSSSPVF